MIEILLGFAGALALVILLFCGGLLGWFAHKTFIEHTTPAAEPLTEKERKKMVEEQQAFRQMQSYSAEQAYGMNNDDYIQRSGGDS
jgi:hypothetical protein